MVGRRRASVRSALPPIRWAVPASPRTGGSNAFGRSSGAALARARKYHSCVWARGEVGRTASLKLAGLHDAPAAPGRSRSRAPHWLNCSGFKAVLLDRLSCDSGDRSGSLAVAFGQPAYLCVARAIPPVRSWADLRLMTP